MTRVGRSRAFVFVTSALISTGCGEVVDLGGSADAGKETSLPDVCGSLDGPDVPSTCFACKYDCQPNGCYGGYFCNRTTEDCEKPPKTCP